MLWTEEMLSWWIWISGLTWQYISMEYFVKRRSKPEVVQTMAYPCRIKKKVDQLTLNFAEINLGITSVLEHLFGVGFLHCSRLRLLFSVTWPMKGFYSTVLRNVDHYLSVISWLHHRTEFFERWIAQRKLYDRRKTNEPAIYLMKMISSVSVWIVGSAGAELV